MNEQLRDQIKLELEQLRGVADLASQIIGVEETARRPWDAAAAAKLVADLSAGLENLCKRRMIFLKLQVPDGANSHSEMLTAFLEDDDFQPSIDEDFALRLKKYLRFRHRFIHGYGHQVNWEIVEEPLKLLPDTVDRLAAIWEVWLDNLPYDSN
jgi:hypothetical protein